MAGWSFMLNGAAWPKPVRRRDMTARQCRNAVRRGSHQIGGILSAAILILLIQTGDLQAWSGHDFRGDSCNPLQRLRHELCRPPISRSLEAPRRPVVAVQGPALLDRIGRAVGARAL